MLIFNSAVWYSSLWLVNVIMYFLWTLDVWNGLSIVTRSYYWILGENVDFSGSPWGVPDETCPLWRGFGVLSVWWKLSASVSALFQAVLPHHLPHSSWTYKQTSLPTSNKCSQPLAWFLVKSLWDLVRLEERELVKKISKLRTLF